MSLKKKIAVIGVGNIGRILVNGLLKSKLVDSDHILGSTKNHNKNLTKQFGIKTFTDNALMVKEADIIVLAVKPQTIQRVLSEIDSAVKPSQLIITLAAATDTMMIEEALGMDIPVIRAMPNTPCLINEGMTVLCPGQYAEHEHLEIAKQIFESLGRVEIVTQEELMDAVTALSGCGPAYAYIIVESLAEGGVKAGLPRELATTLAAQSLLGGAKMVLETGEHPAKLKDSVTTPAGVAMDGIMELEDGGLRVTLIKAVTKATDKSKEISH